MTTEEQLDVIKKLYQALSGGNTFSRTPAFSELSPNDQLAHMVVTKAMLDVLSERVDTLCEQLGISTEDSEEKLAQVIQLFDGNRRQMKKGLV